MSSKNILLIDDTTDFSAGLERLLVSMGHTARSCTDLEQAKEMLSIQKYDYILVDCFMPMADGFAVSKELSKLLNTSKHSFKIIMMSGIIIDDKTQKEALSKDYILDFLVKPISKKDLESCIGPSKEENLFNDLASIDNASGLIKLLESKKKIRGVDLSFFITAVSKFELSCELKLVETETSKSYSLYVKSGSLDRITSSEYNNALGELLVEAGFLLKEDLTSYISSPDFESKKQPIGEALIKLNALSPHALPITLMTQNKKRLCSLFCAKEFEFEFLPMPHSPSDGFGSLNLHDLRQEASDFLMSESLTCLNELKPLIENLKLSHSPLDSTPNNIKAVNIDSSNYSNNDLKVILSNLVLENITVDSSDDVEKSFEKNQLLALISDLQFKLKSNDPYTILDVKKDSTSDQKISKSYQEIAKALHPDKVRAVLKKDELILAESTFTKISEHFNLIKTADNRKTYESILKNQSTQIRIHCNNILEESKQLLNKGEYNKAFEKLNTEQMQETPPREYSLFLLWAALKTKKTNHLKESVNSLFEQEKKDLSNEALFFYLKSLHALNTNDQSSFKNYIQKSLQSDPSFLPARRELQIVKSHSLSKTPPSSKSSWFSFKKSS